MAKPPSTVDTTTSRPASKTNSFGISDIRAATRTTVLFLYLVIILFGILFALFLTQTLQISSSFTPTTSSSQSTWSLSGQFQKLVNMTTSTFTPCTAPTISVVEEARNSQLEAEIEGLVQKLRRSVTFLPLKDLRFAHTPMDGQTWFMSSLDDIYEDGEVQHMKFPSESSLGRVLCLQGNNTHDGIQNAYALAWPDALPPNATYMQGLTFVSQSHYIYENPWHGISTIHPFVAWHQIDHCRPGPDRWVIYFQGELRTEIGPWLNNITDATFERPTNTESFSGVEGRPVCFEEAVVLRHGGAGLSKERSLEAYDLIRCKARKYCKLGVDRGVEPGVLDIGLTVLMRMGSRSFRNESEVVRVFQKECDRVDGCRLMVAHSDDLSFCDQVKLMSKTDILVSPHGGQLANLFMMDRNSSIMELYPKGFHLMGPGQYVFQWLASWSGMRHTGIWRDPQGDCPYPEVEDPRCTQYNKNGRIGLNETYFAEWSRSVLQEVKMRKTEELSSRDANAAECICRSRR